MSGVEPTQGSVRRLQQSRGVVATPLTTSQLGNVRSPPAVGLSRVSSASGRAGTAARPDEAFGLQEHNSDGCRRRHAAVRRVESCSRSSRTGQCPYPGR